MQKEQVTAGTFKRESTSPTHAICMTYYVGMMLNND